VRPGCAFKKVPSGGEGVWIIGGVFWNIRRMVVEECGEEGPWLERIAGIKETSSLLIVSFTQPPCLALRVQ
jgi:hypothetical protein